MDPWPEPGDYWRHVRPDGSSMVAEGAPGNGNLTGGVWGICAPNGAIGTLMRHTVREHEEDGTISVRPGDGSSNSILIGWGDVRQWHGYIEHGVWSEV